MKKPITMAFVILMVSIMTMTIITIGCKTTAQETTSTAAVSETTTAETTTTMETSSTVQELGVKPPEAKVTVKLMSWAWFDDEKQYNELYNKFKEKYPNIEITVDRPSTGDYDSLLNTGLLGGSGPDIFATNAGGGMAGLVRYKDYALDLDEFCTSEWGNNWQDNFSKAVMSSVYWGTDETLGLPEYVQCYGSAGYYNKTMFDKLGISAPKTWDELLKISKTLTDNNIGPIAHTGEAWTNDQLWMSLVADFAGEKLFQAIDGKASFTDKEFVDATAKLKEMFDNKLFGKDPFGGAMYFDKINAFYEGKYGMSFMGNWEFRVAIGQDVWGEQDKNVVFKVWPYPDWNQDGKNPPAIVYPSTLWTINKETSKDNQTAAWIVLKELVSGIFAEGRAIQPNWMAFSSVVPDFNTLNLSKNGEDQGGTEQYLYWSDAIKNAIGMGQIKYPEIAEAIDKNILEVANGQKTPEEAMEAIEEVSKNLARSF